MTDAKRSAFYSARTADGSAAYLLPHIEPHHKILDVGCGPGSITLGLAALVPNGSVTGIDINDTFVETARKSASDLRIQNVTFMSGVDITKQTAFEDGEFDIIHAHQVITHIPDPVAAMREIYRLLKQGGVFGTRDIIHMAAYPTDNAVIAGRMAARYDRARDRGAHPEAGLETHAWAAEAGFSYDQMERQARGWQIDRLDERRRWAERVGRSWSAEGEEDMMEKAWQDWAERGESWITALDGCLIAKKE